MKDLTVPKWRTRVELLLPTKQTLSVAVYLSDIAADHPGPERLSDLMNGLRDFLPAHDLDKDQLTFINREQISAVRVLMDIEGDPSEQFNVPQESEVRVLLKSGAEIQGLLTYTRPDDRARVLDYLNEAAPFFPVQEKDHVTLINKSHVARVELIPRPTT